MICPWCQSELTVVNGEFGIGFECREKYFFLEKDYPVCHYAYRKYSKSFPCAEHRYLFYPFIIYSFPEINKSEIFYLYKQGAMNHHGRKKIANTKCIFPDFNNLESLFEKLNIYLTFI